MAVMHDLRWRLWWRLLGWILCRYKADFADFGLAPKFSSLQSRFAVQGSLVSFKSALPPPGGLPYGAPVAYFVGRINM
jgi:hypothetical protein